MITKEKMAWSIIKFSQLILWRNVWRSVWRICMWILGLNELKQNLFQISSGPVHSFHFCYIKLHCKCPVPSQATDKKSIIYVPLTRCIFTNRTIGMTSFSIGTNCTIGIPIWRLYPFVYIGHVSQETFTFTNKRKLLLDIRSRRHFAEN